MIWTEKQQLELFKSGIPPIQLTKPATIGDGIVRLKEGEALSYIKRFENTSLAIQKMVPASGAATRMFKSLIEANRGKPNEEADYVLENRSRLPFDLSSNNPLKEILEDWGFQHSPKGLLPFHRYKNTIKTPCQEHMVEAKAYGGNKVHFTVSSQHLSAFEHHLRNEKEVQISFSYQSKKTDTLTVDLENRIVLNDNGEKVYRPAGHGALLQNLNELEEDIIFLKNIDNVVPDRLKDETIEWKKILGGILISFIEKVHDLLRNWDGSKEDQARELLSEMGMRGNIDSSELFDMLNRPILICGMVKNQGEPGGGPFWVSKNGKESLQIVESAQMDLTDETQKQIVNLSTHFNPVDLVCSIKDYQGNPFDLDRYTDPETGFISQKSLDGKPVKALELPGLWNGSMANWNTIFVEVPLITFNPVKTVKDLLRPEHQA